jgi:signal transduction histidine kinase
LTIIDASTEVLELEQGENRWTNSIRNQVKRLASLTENLVSLTRMGESENALTQVDFSLSDAVSEVAETFVAPARTNGKSIEMDVEQNISFTGDESAVRRLVSILLDNAIKYSSAGAAIKLSLKRQGKYAVITCANPVDSIAKGDLDVFFERFYRGDSSRGEQTAGYGIGLSMARAIVTAHKGRITARSDDGESVVITAQL